MKNERKYFVKFDPDAVKEYNKLDNSIIEMVDKKIDELEIRADEIGKDLRNSKDTKLGGCKEIKLRDAGIRIIFRITNETVEVLRIVYILTIEKRSNDLVFKLADGRNKIFRNLTEKELKDKLKRSSSWSANRRGGK